MALDGVLIRDKRGNQYIVQVLKIEEVVAQYEHFPNAWRIHMLIKDPKRENIVAGGFYFFLFTSEKKQDVAAMLQQQAVSVVDVYRGGLNNFTIFDTRRFGGIDYQGRGIASIVLNLIGSVIPAGTRCVGILNNIDSQSQLIWQHKPRADLPTSTWDFSTTKMGRICAAGGFKTHKVLFDTELRRFIFISTKTEEGQLINGTGAIEPFVYDASTKTLAAIQEAA